MRTWVLGEKRWRGVRLVVADLSILVAVSMEMHLRYLAQLRGKLWIGAAAASLLAILIVCLAVQRGHAPLRRISRIVSGVTSEQLHLRLDPKDVPIELDPLVASFNTMLDRLEASFERMARMIGDMLFLARADDPKVLTDLCCVGR